MDALLIPGKAIINTINTGKLPINEHAVAGKADHGGSERSKAV